jgi:hypothetical protein
MHAAIPAVKNFATQDDLIDALSLECVNHRLLRPPRGRITDSIMQALFENELPLRSGVAFLYQDDWGSGERIPRQGNVDRSVSCECEGRQAIWVCFRWYAKHQECLSVYGIGMARAVMET